MSSLTNTMIGEYRLAESLGAGGMGEVYKAIHTHFGRVIAVKVLSPNLTDGPALQRFYNEADIQASLKHPSVAEYLGFYEHQGRPCILMEYVDGETLAAIIQQRGAMTVRDAVHVLSEVSAAIAHLHAQGVVHRDIKAGNIKRTTSGQIKILDFGIARHQRSDRITHLGAVVGTTESLAPEQVRGEPAGFPADVWQLGVMLYELLAGTLPFQAGTTHETYQRILVADYVPIRRLKPEVPEAVDRIVSRCLQKAPSRRYPSAAALNQALCSWQQSPVPLPQRRLHLHVGKRWKSMLAAGAAIAALSFSLLQWHRAAGNHGIHTDFQEPEPSASHAGEANAAIKTILVDTMDGPAHVLQGDNPVGLTPYPVRARMGESVNLILRRDGYEDLRVQFDVTERHVYTYVLKPGKDR